MLDPLVPNIICIETQKQFITLNNIGVLRKIVLTDLRARIFLHKKLLCVHVACMFVTVCAICWALTSFSVTIFVTAWLIVVFWVFVTKTLACFCLRHRFHLFFIYLSLFCTPLPQKGSLKSIFALASYLS